MAAPLTRPVPFRLIGPSSDLADPVVVDVPSNEISPGVTLADGVLHVENEDGSITIDFSPPEDEVSSDDGFYRNLVNDIEESELNDIASQLLDGIQRDIDSRKEWLTTRERGIQLLGLKLEEPRGDIGSGSAPLEGMSTVRHPLLLEATIRFQATARGELLPAGGPLKVRNDTPPQAPSSQSATPPLNTPGPAGMAGAGLPPDGLAPAPLNPAQQASPFATELAIPPIVEKDTLADALEMDFNHYLTVTATEYVPDTDRMLFYIGFGGDGFKKVFNCPLKRRPVSESVDAEDLIVSNAATDLKNCGRITHRIKMRKSILKRMQIMGVYADVDLVAPASVHMDPVEEAKREIEGINPFAQKPEDRDYEIYECYCEWDLDKFAPEQFKGEGLPLPYRVTLEKQSRKILSIIRNWNEDDEQCLPKQFFVQFPFIRGLGFYGLGFVHVLGNTTSTLTAMWREMVDAGMFANFPGFIIGNEAGRQLTNQFRVPPGGAVKVNLPMGGRVSDNIMPLPYKEPGGSFTAFAQWVESAGQRLGQTAQIAIGEGKQEAPVGTTLALIEQATKLLDSVHKRLHWAQSEEFTLLKERFKEDPEAFWRHNKKPAMKWEREQFLKALDDYNLVPVADPNNPTSLHRTAKAAALEGLMSKYPQLINQQAALQRIFRVAGIDSEGLFYPEPLPPPPDPRMVAIQQKAESTFQVTQAQAQTAMAKAIANVIVSLKQLEDKSADRASKENIEKMRMMLQAAQKNADRQDKQGQIVGDHISRMSELQADRARTAQELEGEQIAKMQELQADRATKAQEFEVERLKKGQELRDHRLEILGSQQRHAQTLAMKREQHEQDLRHKREMHEMELEQARALAEIKKKSETKKKSGDS